MLPVILVSLVVLVGLSVAILFILAGYGTRVGKGMPTRPGRVWQWFAGIVLIASLAALFALLVKDYGDYL